MPVVCCPVFVFAVALAYLIHNLYCNGNRRVQASMQPFICNTIRILETSKTALSSGMCACVCVRSCVFPCLGLHLFVCVLGYCHYYMLIAINCNCRRQQQTPVLSQHLSVRLLCMGRDDYYNGCNLDQNSLVYCKYMDPSEFAK